jgi:sporulation protein YlmC with PRC-barrel domain
LSIDNLLDTDVRGSNGEELGEVEDVLISPDGQVDSIIVEGGGFWDIGDTHFRVAWDKVDIGSDMEYVTIPMTEENVEEFSVFADWDDQETVRRWRATELLNDYVSLEDVPTYGVINDLIISNDGQVQAVIVTPDISYGVTGPYPYPYYGYTPNAIYELPYAREDIAEWEPFDYDKL